MLALSAMNSVLDDGQRIDPETAQHVLHAVDGLLQFPSSAKLGWELVSQNVRTISQVFVVCGVVFMYGYKSRLNFLLLFFLNTTPLLRPG